MDTAPTDTKAAIAREIRAEMARQKMTNRVVQSWPVRDCP